MTRTYLWILHRILVWMICPINWINLGEMFTQVDRLDEMLLKWIDVSTEVDSLMMYPSVIIPIH